MAMGFQIGKCTKGILLVMKIYINISDTGGYPKGVIPHMIKAIKAFRFHLNYFYDAHILKHLVN
jgi:hypothetical protein